MSEPEAAPPEVCGQIPTGGWACQPRTCSLQCPMEALWAMYRAGGAANA